MRYLEISPIPFRLQQRLCAEPHTCNNWTSAGYVHQVFAQRRKTRRGTNSIFFVVM
jgi:hypothetical protein